jgi:hypothetical protein
MTYGARMIESHVGEGAGERNKQEPDKYSNTECFPETPGG